MNLSKKTIKFLVDYLEGIKSISPGYLDSSEVIKDFEDYIVFMSTNKLNCIFYQRST